jgi:hypothetical protein
VSLGRRLARLLPYSTEGAVMLVLGVTADDKGTQLEALVHTELESQGYVEVYSNVVGSGGTSLMSPPSGSLL